MVTDMKVRPMVSSTWSTGEAAGVQLLRACTLASAATRPRQRRQERRAEPFISVTAASRRAWWVTRSWARSTSSLRRPPPTLRTCRTQNLHDNVAGLRINQERTTRALEAQPPDGRDQTVTIGLAAGRFQRLVDHMHAVVTTHRRKIRIALELGIIGRNELPIQPRGIAVVVMPHRHDAESGIAHVLQRALVDHLARADDLDLGGIHAALRERLAERSRLRAPRNEDENRLRTEILRPLHEGRKSGLATGMRTEPTNSPPAFLNASWKASPRSLPGAKSDTIV